MKKRAPIRFIFWERAQYWSLNCSCQSHEPNKPDFRVILNIPTNLFALLTTLDHLMKTILLIRHSKCATKHFPRVFSDENTNKRESMNKIGTKCNSLKRFNMSKSVKIPCQRLRSVYSFPFCSIWVRRWALCADRACCASSRSSTISSRSRRMNRSRACFPKALGRKKK